MKIKKGDFVEIDYVGRLQENNAVFDVTSEEVAKKEGLHNPRQTYGARIVCVGEGHVVKGMDASFEGKEPSTYTISLGPEEAFGKKNPKLMKIVPMQIFQKEKIKPFPGLHVNMDGFIGIVRSVSGGRIVVDFNHPLAGRNVTYEVMVKRIVTEVRERVKAFLRVLFGREVPFTFAQEILKIDFTLPEQMRQRVVAEIKRVIPEVKDVRFEAPSSPQEGTKNGVQKATTQK